MNFINDETNETKYDPERIYTINLKFETIFKNIPMKYYLSLIHALLNIF